VSTSTKTEVHLSHSQVSEFVQCPRKYHLHRRLGLKPEFAPSGLVFGSCVHEALSAFHQARLEGRSAGLAELVRAFQERWSAETLPLKFGKGESEKSLRTKAKGMLRFYLDNSSCRGQVIAVEEPFRIVLSEHIPPVFGRIDLVELSPEGSLVLTDFKTAGSRREPDPGQLVLYREALRHLDYPGVDSARVKYELLLKTKEPGIAVYEPEVSEESVDRLRSLYRAVWPDIQAGCSFPHEGWWCESCQWRSACLRPADSQACGQL